MCLISFDFLEINCINHERCNHLHGINNITSSRFLMSQSENLLIEIILDKFYIEKMGLSYRRRRKNG